MRRNNSQHLLAQRADYTSTPQEVDPLRSSFTQSSNTSLTSFNGKKLTDTETLTNKVQRQEGNKRNYETSYLKLAHMIQEAYFEIKYQTVENNPSCFSLLKKSIPFDEDDEITLKTDPAVLFQYIKQIYDKNFELKASAEKDLSEEKDNGANDYEAMLQKLEAEVRQHIRIEQQLKLYVESTQAKLDELEKNGGDSSQIEDLKKVIQELRNENSTLTDKLKRRTTEIESFFKDLNQKTATIKKLEQQLETIPALKNKIRELETMLSNEVAKSSGASTLRSYNRSSKEGESFSKALNQSTNNLMGEGRSRKNSQPAIGIPPQDLIKKKGHDKDKNKENYEALKMEFAKYNNGDVSKHFDNYRLNSDNNRIDKIIGYSKTDTFNPKTSRQTEKYEEPRPSAKTKKTGRSESSSNLHREKSKVTDNDGYAEERMSNLRMMGNTNNDIIEQSRFGSERMHMIYNDSSEDYQRKLLEKRRESKSKNDFKETSDIANLSTSRQKIPKTSRPSTGHERPSYVPEPQKTKRENDGYEVHHAKVSSQDKVIDDRSQSLDAKARFYKELQARGENLNKPVEDKSRRRSDYNLQSKQHNTLSSSHRGSGAY